MDKVHKFAQKIPDNMEKKRVLENLYWEEGLTQKEIGVRFEVSHATIKHWMEKLGIERRHGSALQRFNRFRGGRWQRAIGFNPGIHIYKTKWRSQYVVTATSFTFVEWYKNLSLRDIEKLLVDKECFREFIRGFYESEGTFGDYYDTKRYKRIGFSNTNPSLLRVVDQLLSQLGYSFHLNGPYESIKHGKVYKPMYHLETARGKQVERFLSEIKPCIKNIGGRN